MRLKIAWVVSENPDSNSVEAGWDGASRSAELCIQVGVGGKLEGEDEDRAEVWISPVLAT